MLSKPLTWWCALAGLITTPHIPEVPITITAAQNCHKPTAYIRHYYHWWDVLSTAYSRLLADHSQTQAATPEKNTWEMFLAVKLFVNRRNLWICFIAEHLGTAATICKVLSRYYCPVHCCYSDTVVNMAQSHLVMGPFTVYQLWLFKFGFEV